MGLIANNQSGGIINNQSRSNTTNTTISSTVNRQSNLNAIRQQVAQQQYEQSVRNRENQINAAISQISFETDGYTTTIKDPKGILNQTQREQLAKTGSVTLGNGHTVTFDNFSQILSNAKSQTDKINAENQRILQAQQQAEKQAQQQAQQESTANTNNSKEVGGKYGISISNNNNSKEVSGKTGVEITNTANQTNTNNTKTVSGKAGVSISSTTQKATSTTPIAGATAVDKITSTASNKQVYNLSTSNKNLYKVETRYGVYYFNGDDSTQVYKVSTYIKDDAVLKNAAEGLRTASENYESAIAEGRETSNAIKSSADAAVQASINNTNNLVQNGGSAIDIFNSLLGTAVAGYFSTKESVKQGLLDIPSDTLSGIASMTDIVVDTKKAASSGKITTQEAGEYIGNIASDAIEGIKESATTDPVRLVAGIGGSIALGGAVGGTAKAVLKTVTKSVGKATGKTTSKVVGSTAKKIDNNSNGNKSTTSGNTKTTIGKQTAPSTASENIILEPTNVTTSTPIQSTVQSAQKIASNLGFIKTEGKTTGKSTTISGKTVTKATNSTENTTNTTTKQSKSQNNSKTTEISGNTTNSTKLLTEKKDTSKPKTTQENLDEIVAESESESDELSEIILKNKGKRNTINHSRIQKKIDTNKHIKRNGVVDKEKETISVAGIDKNGNPILKKTSPSKEEKQLHDTITFSDSKLKLDTRADTDTPYITTTARIRTPNGKVNATIRHESDLFKEKTSNETALTTMTEARTPKTITSKNLKSGRTITKPTSGERKRIRKVVEKQKETTKSQNKTLKIIEEPKAVRTTSIHIPKDKMGRPIRAYSEKESIYLENVKKGQENVGLRPNGKPVKLSKPIEQGVLNKEETGELTSKLKTVERRARQERNKVERERKAEIEVTEPIHLVNEVKIGGKTVSEFKTGVLSRKQKTAKVSRDINKTGTAHGNNPERVTAVKKFTKGKISAGNDSLRPTKKSRKTLSVSKNVMYGIDDDNSSNLLRYGVRTDGTYPINRTGGSKTIDITGKTIIRKTKTATKKHSKQNNNKQKTQNTKEHTVDVEVDGGNGQKMIMKKVVKTEEPTTTTTQKRRNTTNTQKRTTKTATGNRNKYVRNRNNTQKTQNTNTTTTTGKQTTPTTTTPQSTNTQNLPAINKPNQIATVRNPVEKPVSTPNRPKTTPSTKTPIIAGITAEENAAYSSIYSDTYKELLEELKEPEITITATPEYTTQTKNTTLQSQNKKNTDKNGSNADTSTLITTGNIQWTGNATTNKQTTSQSQTQTQATSSTPNNNPNNKNTYKDNPNLKKKTARKRYEDDTNKKKKKKPLKAKRDKYYLRGEKVNQFGWLGIDLEPAAKTVRMKYQP